MKKLYLLLLTLSIVHLSVLAGNVSEAEALQKAQQFLKGKSFQQKRLNRAPSTNQEQSFYVFNAEEQNGFVIVSADDRTLPILGYSDKGSFDLSKLPLNAQHWLEGYAEQIRALGDAPVEYVSRRALGAPIEPLLTSHWDQRSPYNNRCPMDTEWETNSVTGCVATAMAQVMYYYKYPQQEVAAMPQYGLPAITFNWDVMKDEYMDGEGGESAYAVADLMLYCGRAVNMAYSAEKSSARVNASDMINTFYFSQSARDVSRSAYTSEEWDLLIYNELKEKRPVLYSGFSADAGHEFIIDGYDKDGYFHVNWGWGGFADAYFALSILYPNDLGTGGGSSVNGFTMNQEAIIGLQPDHGESPAPPIVHFDFNGIGTIQYERTSSEEDFDMTFAANLFNFDNAEFPVEIAFALYNNEERVYWQETGGTTTVTGNGYYTPVQANGSFGKNITNGTYIQRIYYHTPYTAEWQLCSNYENVAALWTIKDNTLTRSIIGPVPSPESIQINSVELEGTLKQWRTMTAVINWTNKGYLNETTFYVFIDGIQKEYAASYVLPGQTGEFPLNFFLSSVGNINVEIATDPERSNVVWSKSLTVESSLKPQITATLDIEGMKNSTIEETTLNVEVTFKNEGKEPYNDKVGIYLDQPDEEDAVMIESTPRNISLAVGEEKKMTFHFAGLIAEKDYYLSAYHYVYKETGHFKTSAGGGTWVTVGVKMAMDMSVNITNLNGDNKIKGNTAKLEIKAKNACPCNYYDNIYVDTEYLGDDNEYHFVKTNEVFLNLGIGTERSVDCDISGLQAGKTYRFVIYILNQKNERIKSYTTEGYTVKAAYPAIELRCDFDVTNADIERNVQGTVIKADMTIWNNSNYEYDDIIYMHVTKVDSWGEPIQTVKEMDFPLKLAANSHITISHVVEGLEIGSHYMFYASYYPSYNSERGSGMLQSASYTMIEESLDISLRCYLDITNANNYGFVEGNVVKADMLIRNICNNDFDDKVYVDVMEVGDNGNAIKKVKSQEFTLQLAAGAETTVKHEIHELEVGKMYMFIASYYPSENAETKKELVRSGKITMVRESTAVDLDCFDFSVTNADTERNVKDNFIETYMHIYNASSNAFDDKIYMDAIEVDEAGEPINTAKQQNFELKLAAGKSAYVTRKIEGLEVGKRYIITVSFYPTTHSELVETMYQSDIYTIVNSGTEINQIMSDENSDAMIFTIDGKRVNKLQKNLNIIRMKDGTTRKVMKK